MIHYDLRCAGGHNFDGWFRSSTAFDEQSAAGLVDCPTCASTSVTRAIMAPRVSTGLRRAHPRETEPTPEPAAATPDAQTTEVAVTTGPSEGPASSPMPDQVRAVLQRIRAEIEQKCDYVGPRFAEQARAMHEGEVEARPIYGETTPAEAEALAEDGIEVSRIPWISRADS
jgi:hypothetical protein